MWPKGVVDPKPCFGQVGIFSQENKLHYFTIEGNSNGSISRDGDGVYMKFRKKESVFVVSDFIFVTYKGN